MKIFILRHAQSTGNERKTIDSIGPKFDLGLSDEGKKQAKELVPKLSKYDFDVFIVSPLKRTLDTIKPFLETLKKPKLIVSELILERNAGDLIGKPLGSLKKYCEKHNIDDLVSFRPSGGESILEVYERTKKFLDFLKSEFSNESILICGHHTFLRCFEILLTEKNILDYYSYEGLKNGEIKEFDVK
jgi:broad specificity phosphatase PhoE